MNSGSYASSNGSNSASFLIPDARILIVAQPPSMSRRLAELVQSSGYRTFNFENAAELLTSPHLHPPCCVLLASDLTQCNGLDLQLELAHRLEFTPVIVVGEHSSVKDGVAAMKAGAVDYLVKPFEASVLGEAIQAGLLKQAKLAGLNQCSARFRKGWQKLTAREREVLSFVINGFLNKQIAAELGISEKTIKVHRGRVMKKMQVASFAELVRLAERASIAENLSNERFSSHVYSPERNGSQIEPAPNSLT